MSAKKKKQSRPAFTNLPRRLREGLEETSEYLEYGQPELALSLLLQLKQKYPRYREEVLCFMADTYMEMDNSVGYLDSVYHLNQLAPNKAQYTLVLADGYLANDFFALSLQTYRQFVERWPDHEATEYAQDMIEKLEQEMPLIIEELGLLVGEGFDILSKHEEVRLHMTFGNFDNCRKVGAALLEELPQFAPALNNLSMAEWMDGNLPGAIENAHKVLEFEPENVHALSNLTRYTYLSGEEEMALEYAHRLKLSEAPAADVWKKKAEALLLIGDDQGILALLEQAKKEREQNALGSVFMHSCAAAAYRLGDIRAATKYWKKSAKRWTYSNLARGNLKELKKPLHERICPQVFMLEAWLPNKKAKEIFLAVERITRMKKEDAIRQKVSKLIDLHPEIVHFGSEALRFGDVYSRDFILNLAELSGHKQLLSVLKEIALGTDGPDAMRLEAAQILTKHGVFSTGETIDLWLKGRQTPILMFEMEITDEPNIPPKMKASVARLIEQGYDALQSRDSIEAEQLMRKALAVHGDEPTILNNLALALEMQGKEEEVNQIVEKLSTQFPDYFFGLVFRVKKAISEGRLDDARPILDKMMKRTKMHFSELDAMCECQIGYSIADQDPESARSWLEIWKQTNPEQPTINDVEASVVMLELISGLPKMISKFGSKPSISKEKGGQED
jgi:tetratricopeptide (TPR) repeat protein